jgi:phosphoribosyl-ATP pyrophosphohydrolase
MTDPNELQRDAWVWSRVTFGEERGPDGPLNHLRREIDEVIEAVAEGRRLDAIEEYADCYLLLLDSLSRYGVTIAEVAQEAERKLEKNKARKWAPLNEQGFSEHIKD